MRKINTLIIFFVLSCFCFAAELRFSLSDVVLTEPILKVLNEVAAELSKRTGIKITFVPLPSERALVVANMGETDGDFMRASVVQGKYPNLVIVPESLTTTKTYAFGKGKRDFTPTWENLKDYNVIASLGAKYPETMLVGKMKKGQYSAISGGVNVLFKMILTDRADFAIVPNSYGMQSLVKKTDPQKELYRYEPPLAIYETYIVLNKSHADLVPILSEALKAMKKDGTYDRLFSE